MAEEKQKFYHDFGIERYLTPCSEIRNASVKDDDESANPIKFYYVHSAWEIGMKCVGEAIYL